MSEETDVDRAPMNKADAFLKDLSALMERHGVWINVSLDGDTHGLFVSMQVCESGTNETLATVGYDEAYLDVRQIRDYFRDKSG